MPTSKEETKFGTRRDETSLGTTSENATEFEVKEVGVVRLPNVIVAEDRPADVPVLDGSVFDCAPAAAVIVALLHEVGIKLSPNDEEIAGALLDALKCDVSLAVTEETTVEGPLPGLLLPAGLLELLASTYELLICALELINPRFDELELKPLVCGPEKEPEGGTETPPTGLEKGLELGEKRLLDEEVLVDCEDDDCAMLTNVLTNEPNSVLDVVYVLNCKGKLEVLVELVYRMSLEEVLDSVIAGLGFPLQVNCVLDNEETELPRVVIQPFDEACDKLLSTALAEEGEDWRIVSVANVRDLDVELTAELQAAPP